MKKSARIIIAILNVVLIGYIVWDIKIFTYHRFSGIVLSILTALNVYYLIYPFISKNKN